MFVIPHEFMTSIGSEVIKEVNMASKYAYFSPISTHVM